MSKVDDILARYKQMVTLPWKERLDGSQKVWFVVYPPEYEREIRARTDEFKLATTGAGKDWLALDLTTSFPQWMADHEYREGYFEEPEDIHFIAPDFKRALEQKIRSSLEEATSQTVVALTGTGTLFGLVYISDIIKSIDNAIPGRLVVFFPGRHEGNTYRLLDARDGWDYLAVPIKA